MATTTLALEDLILSSRSLSLEEKQELLKRLDMLDPEKQEKLRSVLEREFEEFQKFDRLQLSAIQGFTQNLQNITAGLAAA